MVNREAVLPLLPLRGIMVFPGNIVHLDVGREKSVKALDDAMALEQFIILATQRDAQQDDPSEEEIYDYGTLAIVSQMMKLPGGAIRVLAEGIRRVKIKYYTESDTNFRVCYEELHDSALDESLENVALRRMAVQKFSDWVKLNERVPPDATTVVAMMKDARMISDSIISHLTLSIEDKYEYLKNTNTKERLENICVALSEELEILELEKKISTRVKTQVEKTQKDFYLRKQIKAINVELGDKEDKVNEIEEYRKKVNDGNLPKAVAEKVHKEINRLEKMPPMFAEGAVVRNYLECLLSIPWSKSTEDAIDIDKSEAILDEDHYGLKKVKERILEYLAVKQLNPNGKGSILCLCGPPGVGKTSLARSVARAMGRKFVRASLGGVRDEAEMRGHRRTYVGAMPGRIIQGMRDAGVKNPVFLLDEVDKMSTDFRGDPSSALLEILDPEQNNTFSDHYVELPFDLSQVFWIVTANAVYNIPRPLLDRMELIEISGYTEEEKVQIAIRHLVPKTFVEHGIKQAIVDWEQESVLKDIIRGYTREAGVRNLERKIAALCRKVARQIVQKKKRKIKIIANKLNIFLGVPRYRKNAEEQKTQVGVATGLAWTEAGGEILPVEVLCVPGKGGLVLTGQLGEVMQESAQAAFTYIRSCAEKLGIYDYLGKDFHEKYDLHVHIPEGAIPKDGPSAGITMATAMCSALSNRAVVNNIAMTGEVTLRGRVLPIGGLKEKVLAAHRNGIKKIIIPKENKRDLEDIPSIIKKEVKIFLLEHMDEVLEKMLVKQSYRENVLKKDETDVMAEAVMDDISAKGEE